MNLIDFSEEELNEEITVCAECLTSTCWHGIFMCQKSKYANITKKTRRELLALNRENPFYWRTDQEWLKVYGKTNIYKIFPPRNPPK